MTNNIHLLDPNIAFLTIILVSAVFTIGNSPLKNSSEVYTEILSLPLYPDISKKEQDFVISKIKHLQK